MLYSAETEKGELRVVPVKLLGLIVCASLLGSYLLVPDQTQLVERLMMDKQYDRIQDVLRSSLGSAHDVGHASLKELGNDRLAVLSNLLRLTPREQVQTIFSTTRPVPYDRFSHAVTLAAVKYVDVMTPEQAWALVGKNAQRIPERYMAELSSLLAHNAMATGKPHVAADILATTAALPDATLAVVKEMLQAFRWSGRPGEGAERLYDCLKNRKDLEGNNEVELVALRTLGRQVAMEGGNPGLALDFQLKSLQAMPPEARLSEAEIKETMSLAIQSARTGDVVPWLERYLGGLEQHQMDWKKLAEVKTISPKVIEAYLPWLKQFAQYSDWSSSFDTAFDAHFRLAVLGESASLERCLALGDFLGRVEGVADLLQFTNATEVRPELQVKLAELLANLGRDEDALPIYEKWVANHPEDAEAAYDLGCLFEDMGREEDALRAFASAVKHHPKHEASIRKLAEACIRAGKHSTALDLYAGLPGTAHDHTTLENYALLAESLDRYDHLFRAQVMATEYLQVINVEPYLAIAETAAYLDSAEPAIKQLERGLEKFPNSPGLRMALASVFLRDINDAERCYSVLKHEAVKKSFEGVSLLIEIGAMLANPNDLLKFLGQGVEEKMDLTAQSRLELAVLCSRCGENQRAEKLFKSVPEEGRGLTYLAEARAQLGSLDEAIRLMSRYIDAGGKQVMAEDWIMLGELFEQTGRAKEAENAYQQSLTLLTADLTNTMEPNDTGISKESSASAVSSPVNTTPP
jgi:tetratricopeptide (TPR) repeat protein